MEISREKAGDVLVLHLRGRLDVSTAPELESAVNELIGAGGRRFVIDCRELRYVSSAGLGTFISCGQKLSDDGSLMFSGLSPHLESLFAMTGISGLFTICKSREDALEKMSVSGA